MTLTPGGTVQTARCARHMTLEDHWDKLGLDKKHSRSNCPAIQSLKQRFGNVGHKHKSVLTS
jgi:hypothetical protein